MLFCEGMAGSANDIFAGVGYGKGGGVRHFFSSIVSTATSTIILTADDQDYGLYINNNSTATAGCTLVSYD